LFLIKRSLVFHSGSKSVKQEIARLFGDRGIEGVGVCALRDLPSLIDCRAKSRMPAQAKSVIVCLLPYYPGEYPQRNVARYALCDDYHPAALMLLEGVCSQLRQTFPGHAFVPFVDISPIPEVKAATLAGLGRQGRHGMLIAPYYGCHVFIGSVVTDLAIEPDQPVEEDCGSCRACLSACPSGALTERGFVRERCRSFLTQKRGALEPWQEEEIRSGNLVWGCDICLDACPHKGTVLSPLKEMRKNPLPLLTRENLKDALAVKAYAYRGENVLLRNLQLIEQEK
jgi:epoxyqueuosine reductase